MKITSLKSHGTIVAYRKGCRCFECDGMAEVYELANSYDDYRYMDVDENWEKRANCKGADTNIFLDPSKEKEAKVFCNQCEVKDQCLAYALKYPKEIDGMYGGFSYLNRNRAYRLYKKINRESVSV